MEMSQALVGKYLACCDMLFCSAVRPCLGWDALTREQSPRASAGMQSRLLLTLPRTHLAHL